jgi:hypothetical protein
MFLPFYYVWIILILFVCAQDIMFIIISSQKICTNCSPYSQNFSIKIVKNVFSDLDDIVTSENKMSL